MMAMLHYGGLFHGVSLASRGLEEHLDSRYGDLFTLHPILDLISIV